MLCLLSLASDPSQGFGDFVFGEFQGNEFLRQGVLPQFGDYELTEELARGGMGVVFQGRQKSLNRPVAIKLILAGHLASKEAVRRFRVEAQAAAKLDHPAIVPVFEVGEIEGQHFLSMKFLEGGNLRERLGEFVPSTRDGASGTLRQQRKIAELISRVAEALDFAHKHGVLHRDIKPTNVLIDHAGQPYLSDFGLAKLLDADESELTHSAAVLGSPSYMAPEQAAGNHGNVTTSTDIYGLGAVLYELLTGRPPFLAETPLATMALVVGAAPTPPRKSNPYIGRDLETIALKCLEKRPQDRYGSVANVVEELQRYLAGKPILARPITRPEQLWRWSRRSPWVAGLTVALVLAVGFGIAGVLWQGYLARANNFELRVALNRSHRLNIEAMIDRGEDSLALAHLADRIRNDPSDWQSAMLATSIVRSRRFLRPLSLPAGHEGAEILHAVMHPAGTLFATASVDGTARVWDADTGAELCRATHTAAVNRVAFSHDGALIVSASSDGSVKVTSVASSEEILKVPHPAAVQFALFEPDGSVFITSASDARIRFFSTTDGGQLSDFSPHSRATHLDVSADWKSLLVGCESGEMSLWDISDVGNPRLRTELPAVPGLVACSLVNQDRYVCVEKGRVSYRSIENSQVIFERDTRLYSPPAVAFRSKLIATPVGSRMAQIFELEGGRTVSDRLFSNYGLVSAAFDSTERWLARGDLDYSVIVTDLLSNRTAVSPLLLSSVPHQLRFSDNGERLFIVSGEIYLQADLPLVSRSAAVYEITGATNERTFRPDTARASLTAASTDGNWFAVADLKGNVHLLDRSFRYVRTLRIVDSQFIVGLAFVNDSRRLVIGGADGRYSVYDVETDQVVWKAVNTGHAAYCYRLSPDGELLAVGADNGHVTLWELESAEQFGETLFHEASLNDVGFSRDGRYLATASDDKTGKLWQVGETKLLLTMRHPAGVQAVKFSPDGKRVVTGSDDFTARIWDLSTGRQQGQAMTHRSVVGNAEFDSSGRRILTSARDGSVRVWDGYSGVAVTPWLMHKTAVREANFSPDGRMVATVDHEAMRIWEADSGLLLTAPDFAESVSGIGFDSMGTRSPFTVDGNHVLWGMVIDEAKLVEVQAPPIPVPSWYPDLLEAIGGQELDENGNLNFLPVGPLSRFRKLDDFRFLTMIEDPEEYYSKVARSWFRGEADGR